VKLAHEEARSAELATWADQQTELTLMSSVVMEVELYRALHRNDPLALPRVPEVLARMDQVDLNGTIRAIASAYTYPLLRSLDAVHLATARFLVSSGTPVDAFISYDQRLAEFAAAEGFAVLAP
jgi:hypothetical protein